MLFRNFKEEIQRLQREKDELSLKNENIHDEMTPRYNFITVHHHFLSFLFLDLHGI